MLTEEIQQASFYDTQVGLVTFDTEATVLGDFTSDLVQVQKLVNSVVFGPEIPTRFTNWDLALKAVDEDLNTKARGRRQVPLTIIFLTDGFPAPARVDAAEAIATKLKIQETAHIIAIQVNGAFRNVQGGREESKQLPQSWTST